MCNYGGTHLSHMSRVNSKHFSYSTYQLMFFLIFTSLLTEVAVNYTVDDDNATLSNRALEISKLAQQEV